MAYKIKKQKQKNTKKIRYPYNFVIMKSKDWFSEHSDPSVKKWYKENKEEIDKNRNDFVVIRINLNKEGYESPMKYGFKTKRDARDYINERMSGSGYHV